MACSAFLSDIKLLLIPTIGPDLPYGISDADLIEDPAGGVILVGGNSPFPPPVATYSGWCMLMPQNGMRCLRNWLCLNSLLKHSLFLMACLVVEINRQLITS